MRESFFLDPPFTIFIIGTLSPSKKIQVTKYQKGCFLLALFRDNEVPYPETQ